MARPKVSYYGAFPAGFLSRARALLGVRESDSVLHVCSGKVRDYPYAGLGPNDRTLDLDPELEPDIVGNLLDGIPSPSAAKLRIRSRPGQPYADFWPAILADPPYTEDDAKEYSALALACFPTAREVLTECLKAVEPGGRVGLLHFQWPRPPTEKQIGFKVIPVAAISVLVGYGNRVRLFSVFERCS